jgi:chromosome segregation ATPase
MPLHVVEVDQEQQAEAAPSISALEQKIAQQQKELTRVEDNAREERERLQQMTSRYNEQLKRLANSEEPDGDIHDLKEKMEILSDSVRERQADCEAKRKELKVLREQSSILQAQGTKRKDPAKAALEHKIQTDEKELARLQATIREARTKVAEINSQYETRLKRLANGEEPDADTVDLKRRTNVFSDLISRTQADYEAKRQKLRVLYGELSVLQAQEAEEEELRQLAAVEGEARQVREQVEKLSVDLYKLRLKQGAVQQKASCDREAIFKRKQQREKELRERGQR